MRKRPLVMAILDGWGIGKSNSANPIATANPKNINYVRHTYPAGALQASGIAVGLPWGENGDSEVGHLTLGAGKVLYQHYPRISLAIKDRSFFKNKALLDAFAHAKKNNSQLHIMGLLGKSNIHSSFKHLESLLEFTRNERVENVSVHVFTDGRDSPQKEAPNLIAALPQGLVASVSGRFFAMDRDLHWERTSRVYNMLTGAEESMTKENNIPQILSSSYERGLTDEFVEPTLVQPNRKIKDRDSIVFFNFREDSMKQLVEMFINPGTGGKHIIPMGLHITTFTNYSNKLDLPVAFSHDTVTNPLGKILADSGRVQLRIAETEKYAHVTYFFNGLVEPPFKNEYRVLIPSKNVARHDDYPKMMASEITTRVVSAVSEGVYDFILVNYANADTLGHTGNFDAAVKGVLAVDEQVGLLMKIVLEHSGTLVITADHGNVEHMVNLQTGLPETTHDPSPVPIYVVTNGYERNKTEEVAKQIENGNIGILSDVAPTILELMGIPIPPDMTGISLLRLLR